MRSPRLCDTDGTPYDPETGERVPAGVAFDRALTDIVEQSAARLSGKVDAMVAGLASREERLGETQATLPETDEEEEIDSCGYTGHGFGASYQDAVCIGGFLWDLDSCDEPGGPLYRGGEIPCPSCNVDEHQRHLNDDMEADHG